jgi:ABC-2 type transport system permease protein
VVTVVGSVAILAVSGAGLGAGFLLATGDRGRAWDVTWPVLQYVGPVLLLGAMGRLVFGLAPRFMVFAWVPLVLAAVVLLFGDLLRLPQWLQDLSPFEHLALVPAEDFRWTPVLVVAFVAAAVSVVGQVAFSRRDVH